MGKVITVAGTQVILVAEIHLIAIVKNRPAVDLLFKLQGCHEGFEKGVGGNPQSDRSGQPFLHAAKIHVGTDVGNYGSHGQLFSLIL